MSAARDKLPPIHPGEILRDEMEALGLSARKLATALAVPPNRLTAVLAGRRAITAVTALRLSRYFGTSARFWLNLQQRYDLRRAEIEAGPTIAASVRPRAA